MFEMDMIAPVCLFPMVLPMAPVSVDGIDSGDEDDPATDALWMLLDTSPAAKEGALGFGEEVLLSPDTTPSNPSVCLPPYNKHSNDAPILLDSRFAFHNTVEMLPPATGPPVHLVGDMTNPSSTLPTIHIREHRNQLWTENLTSNSAEFFCILRSFFVQINCRRYDHGAHHYLL